MMDEQPPALPPERPREPPRIVQPAKSPGVAAVLSCLVCGLGQIYNGQILKGVIFFVLFATSVAAIFLVIGFFTTPVMWLWGVVDAYKTAESKNRDAELDAYRRTP